MLFQGYHQYSSIVFLYICLLATINARGETYFVGDGNGWTDLTNSSDWADGKEFHVGDVLVFHYDTSLHNVLQVNSAAYEGCIKEPSKLFASGNDSLVLSDAGEYWFICGISDHCENGQKLGIIVFP